MNRKPEASIGRARRFATWFTQSEWRLFALSGLGALIYVRAGSDFAIPAVRCADWPSAGTGWIAAALYIMALAAMGLAWLGLVLRPYEAETGSRALVRSLVAALVIHAVIFVSPPFLSDDSLAYGAIGALGALHDLPMSAPLGALPADDVYRQMIGQYPAWLSNPGTYGPAFNALAALIVSIAGDDVMLALRLFQIASGLAIIAAGLMAASAAHDWAEANGKQGSASAIRLMTLRLVLLSPLALIEATGNAHNDAFLALAIAVFIRVTVRLRLWTGMVLLFAGLLIKLSNLLPLGFELARHAARFVSTLPKSRLLAALTGAGIAVLAAAWLAIPLLDDFASTAIRLVAPPDGGTPFCTRALECLPRWLFHFVLGWPEAAWITGLFFRLGGVVLMLALAWRNRNRADALPALAAFVLFYYLFFHAYMQAWYLLMLLPLAVFLSAPLRTVALVFILSSLVQYGLDFAWACSKAMPWVMLRELGGLTVVLVPPLIALLVTWMRQGGLNGMAGNSRR